MSGYKTYILAGLIALLTFARAVNWVDQKTFETLLALFGAGGLAALRAGVEKSGPKGE